MLQTCRHHWIRRNSPLQIQGTQRQSRRRRIPSSMQDTATAKHGRARSPRTAQPVNCQARKSSRSKNCYTSCKHGRARGPRTAQPVTATKKNVMPMNSQIDVRPKVIPCSRKKRALAPKVQEKAQSKLRCHCQSSGSVQRRCKHDEAPTFCPQCVAIG